jgi:MoaA/NifB/PqqE/SkfB family radical SAM enzyme
VSLAKQAGCQVGTTTNATPLTEETISRIVESGIDLLAFSLAGIGPVNDTWRQGTSYQKVLEAIRSLQACKRRLGKVTPRVHIAYMLLRSGLADLETLPGELQGLGISQVVISTLDLVAAPELEKESLTRVSQSEGSEISHRLEKLAEMGARHNLNIYYPDLSAPSPKRDCPENVLRAAVISPAGDVSPCVYTNLSASAGDYYVKGRPHQIRPLFFGNLEELSFHEIWQQASYRNFRKSWQKGNLFDPCRNCLKL